MYKINLSEPFLIDLYSNVEYIKRNLQNPVAAKRLSKEVKKAYKKIKENPLLYPLVRDDYLASLGYRFIKVKNYMIFYIVDNMNIEVDRFLYGPMDWANILKNGKPRT